VSALGCCGWAVQGSNLRLRLKAGPKPLALLGQSRGSR
jgi:hypothetical protein